MVWWKFKIIYAKQARSLARVLYRLDIAQEQSTYEPEEWHFYWGLFKLWNFSVCLANDLAPYVSIRSEERQSGRVI